MRADKPAKARRNRSLFILVWVWSTACQAVPSGGVQGECGSDSTDTATETGTGEESDTECSQGDVICEGNTASVCVDSGEWSTVDCATVDQICVAGLGCSDCDPMLGRQETCAADGWATYCAQNGRWRSFYCDPGLGMTCSQDGCEGECSPGALGTNYYGCEYWPTVTPNGLGDMGGAYAADCFHFAVVVANASTATADVTTTRAGIEIGAAAIAPGSQEIIELPWVPELQGGGTGANALAAGGAYRLRADRPVVVYQFSPLEYAVPTSVECPSIEYPPTDECNSYTNDASLLLPTTSLTGDYVVGGWADSESAEDFLAITGVYDGTVVRVTAAASAAGGDGAPDLQPGVEGTVTLNSGDVALWSAQSGSMSGARITTEGGRPVQVISGHTCANVPGNNPACDHLEESVLPLETLGDDYLVVVPRAPNGIARHSVRLHGVAAHTMLSFDPPSVHAPLILGRGVSETIANVETDFRVRADKPFAVTQYMNGQGEEWDPDPQSVVSPAVGLGDPSQSVVVPTRQFRSQYYFYEPLSYDENFVMIIASTGQEVLLDGALVPASEFTPIGSSGYGAAKHLLDHSGAHEIRGEAAFGIVVYGYGDYTSFMYPGGLDLVPFNVPIE